MQKEFDLDSPFKGKLISLLAENASEQVIKVITQGSHGLSKEAFLVLTDQEMFFLKVRRNELQIEERKPLLNYSGASVMMGTLQITFKDNLGKSKIISIALNKGRAKEIQTLISEVFLEFTKKKSTESTELELEEGAIEKGTYIGGFTPESGIQFYERSSSKYSDRKLGKLLQGGGSPIMVYTKSLECNGQIYQIDHLVTADVVFDGQTQVSRRPTLTRMGLLAPLPGSALIAGFALGKKETHDNREVHVVITHPNWSLSIRVRPQDLGPAKSLASRINSIADSMSPAIKNENSNLASSPSDKVSKLKEVKDLQDSGFITAQEAEQMKKEILQT
jgi:hypothetical protein